LQGNTGYDRNEILFPPVLVRLAHQPRCYQQRRRFTKAAQSFTKLIMKSPCFSVKTFVYLSGIFCILKSIDLFLYRQSSVCVLANDNAVENIPLICRDRFLYTIPPIKYNRNVAACCSFSASAIAISSLLL